MVRLGYACINERLPTCNKSCILRTLKESKDPWGFLLEKSMSNLYALKNIIIWNVENNIKFYRLSSSMFPHIGNPKIIDIIGEEKSNLYISLKPFSKILKEIKNVAKGCRLSVHPGQFCQLASPNKKVVENAKIDLLWHANLLDFVGNRESTICIHGGGTWGNKKTALERLEKELKTLPENVLSKVCLENCEKCWSAEELLPVCKNVGIPLIFDFFHYECFSKLHPDVKQKPIPLLLPKILESWGKRRPKFHLSEQDPTKKTGAHSEYVETIPTILLDLGKGFDIMIEAKRKEANIFRLRKKYDGV